MPRIKGPGLGLRRKKLYGNSSLIMISGKATPRERGKEKTQGGFTCLTRLGGTLKLSKNTGARVIKNVRNPQGKSTWDEGTGRRVSKPNTSAMNVGP